jgi:hypothetical protein
MGCVETRTRNRLERNIMARVRSPAQSQQFWRLSWHRPAGLSLGPRRSRLIPRAALLTCLVDPNAPAKKAHFPPTARETQSRSRRPPSPAKPTCRPEPNHAIPPFGILLRNTLPGNGQMVRPQPITCRNRVHRYARLQASATICALTSSGQRFWPLARISTP